MDAIGADARTAAVRAFATFVIVGLGIGIVGAVFLSRMGGDGGLLGGFLTSGLHFLVVVVALVVGPAVAAGVGLEGGSPAGHVGGSLLGYPVMVALAVLVPGLVVGGAGGGGGEALADWLGTILLASIPTGLVAGSVALIRDRPG